MVIKTNMISLVILLMAFSSVNSFAALNPFGKNKSLQFSSDIPWQVSKSNLLKTGVSKQRGDKNYFHLIISDNQLILRFTKNDEMGLKPNTWYIKNLTVLDVMVDGKKLKRFDWCLNNKISASNTTTINQAIRVKDNTCIVDNIKGEILISLDDQSLDQIKQASRLTITTHVDKRSYKLRYVMAGFIPAYAKYVSMQKESIVTITKSTPVLQTQLLVVDDPAKLAPSTLPAVILKTEPKNKSAIMDKPKQPPTIRSKPDVKPVKLCYVKAPVKYDGIINDISYPCDNNKLQVKANKSLKTSILKEKKKLRAKQLKLNAQLERKRLEQNIGLAKAQKQKEKDVSKRERKQLKIDTKRWVKRCQRHWNKKVSPCFCQAYLEHAPTGVKNTCR